MKKQILMLATMTSFIGASKIGYLNFNSKNINTNYYSEKLSLKSKQFKKMNTDYSFPYRIMTDNEGNTYLGDQGNCKKALPGSDNFTITLTGLPEDILITDIKCDSNNNVYVSCYKGVFICKANETNFQKIAFDQANDIKVRKLFITKDQKVYAGTDYFLSSIYFLDKETNKFIKLNSEVQISTIMAIIETKSGKLYVLDSSNKVFKLDEIESTLKIIHEIPFGNVINEAIADNNNNILFFSTNNNNNCSIEFYIPEIDEWTTIEIPEVNKIITTATIDKFDNVYFGTAASDKNDQIWVARENLTNFVPLSEDKFNNITGIVTDQNNNIFLCDRNGAYNNKLI